jgi:rhodanese-related sulfurtransferase
MLATEITAQELKKKLDSGEALHLIDVREPAEHRICRIEGAELIPMRQVAHALDALKAKSVSGPLVCYCHHGVRSLQVASWLRQRGLEAQSLAGGIESWSVSVDAGVPRY